jgi:hypothetical protein
MGSTKPPIQWPPEAFSSGVTRHGPPPACFEVKHGKALTCFSGILLNYVIEWLNLFKNSKKLNLFLLSNDSGNVMKHTFFH